MKFFTRIICVAFLAFVQFSFGQNLRIYKLQSRVDGNDVMIVNTDFFGSVQFGRTVGDVFIPDSNMEFKHKFRVELTDFGYGHPLTFTIRNQKGWLLYRFEHNTLYGEDRSRRIVDAEELPALIDPSITQHSYKLRKPMGEVTHMTVVPNEQLILSRENKAGMLEPLGYLKPAESSSEKEQVFHGRDGDFHIRLGNAQEKEPIQVSIGEEKILADPILFEKARQDRFKISNMLTTSALAHGRAKVANETITTGVKCAELLGLRPQPQQ